MKKLSKAVLLAVCVFVFGLMAMGSDEEYDSSGSYSSASAQPTVDPYEGITVQIVEKSNVDYDFWNGIYDDYVQFKIVASNNSGKTIRGIKGTVDIKDIFGDRIKKVNFELVDTIADGSSKTFKKQKEINRYDDDDVELWNTAYKDLQFTVKITEVVFDE